MYINPDDINKIAQFLAHEQIPPSIPPDAAPSCIVLCVSAILDSAEHVFQTLEQHPRLTQTLVLCGGIGHSTPHLYNAVSRHPRYAHLAKDIHGLPEATVLYMLFTRCFDAARIQQTCRVLIEAESTNCGANATNTRAVLRSAGIAAPQSLVVVQDPTMARRTVASFENAFGPRTRVRSWPTFVPVVRRAGNELVYEVPRLASERLWPMPRFLGLIMGEIPRLRDDEEGYGPRGRGFIGHVDIPVEVEDAWRRLEGVEMQR
ncbi:hypothetical protein BDV59DRAFT_197773 [Aspergillus ambiguus]|uniref:uncharacterized protein n=1 Tax=Aspergillus ambiguus TaxID=176160 RepID=UPI003CCCFEE1